MYLVAFVLSVRVFFSSRRRHTRCALVTGVQTCALPICGPVVFSAALAPFAPLPFVEKSDEGYRLVEEETADEHHAASFGRMVAFHGQMGMFTRALAYILSHGADGLRQVSGDAVLNANYILRSLADVLDAPFGATGPCMHEALLRKGVV